MIFAAIAFACFGVWKYHKGYPLDGVFFIVLASFIENLSWMTQ